MLIVYLQKNNLVFVFLYKFLYKYQPTSLITIRVALYNIFSSVPSQLIFFLFYNLKTETVSMLKINYLILHMELGSDIVLYAYILCVRVQSTVKGFY